MGELITEIFNSLKDTLRETGNNQRAQVNKLPRGQQVLSQFYLSSKHEMQIHKFDDLATKDRYIKKLEKRANALGSLFGLPK